MRARRKDGSTFQVEVSLASDRRDGETLVIAAIRDVTALRASEELARESEARLRQLAENVDTVFTLRQLDPPGFLYVSPAFRKLTGREPQELIDDPGLQLALIHPDDLVRVSQEYLAPSAAGKFAVSEYRIVAVDDAVRWVRATASPVPNPNGEPERIVTTAEDITERIRVAKALEDAEAAARAANNAKNEFLSRMSHELRTPLNAVLGFGQILERRLQDSPHLEPVQHILRAGRHLLNLINEVLDIARIEAGELSISLEPVAVGGMIEETATLMQPLAEAMGIELCVDSGSLNDYVLADRQRLRQVLLNLISNAVKYNRSGGKVWLSWASSQGFTTLVVRDDGPGIPSGMHDRLFVAFDRLGAEATAIEGTGVGLTVSRALTELMHGAIVFDSEIGRGTSFSVSFPVAVATATPVHPDERKGSAAVHTGRPMTVLYVEDNEPNVRVMESLLEMRPGWRLIHAALGRLGLDLAAAHLPDLVLLDLHLPDGSGLDVLKAMRRDPSLVHVPVVVLSADANPSQAKRLLAAGALKYITKPLDITEVLNLFDDVASRTQAEEAVS